MFTAALFTIAKTWKQPKYPATDEWIKKLWNIYLCVCVCVYKMKYYSTIKNAILPFVATSVNLECIRLSEINQTKTNTVYHL